MGIEENQELLRRRLQIWNEEDLELAEEVFATNYISHEPLGVIRRGIDGFTQKPVRLRKGLPDLQMKYMGVIITEDQLAFRWELTGTHTGAIGPFEPVNRRVTLSGMIMSRVANNEIAEEWVQVDFLGFYKQLGLVDFPEILDEI